MPRFRGRAPHSAALVTKKGEGGFIATAADDAEMVTWVSTCDGITRSGELKPNDDDVTMMAGKGAVYLKTTRVMNGGTVTRPAALAVAVGSNPAIP